MKLRSKYNHLIFFIYDFEGKMRGFFFWFIAVGFYLVVTKDFFSSFFWGFEICFIVVKASFNFYLLFASSFLKKTTS